MATTTKPKRITGIAYRTGRINPVTTKYTCVNCEDAGRERVITLPKGAPFPKCDQCLDEVTWRLEIYD
jgi:hypothetical protein